MTNEALAAHLAATYLARPPECREWWRGSEGYPDPESRRLYLWECHVMQHAPDDWSGNVTRCAMELGRLVAEGAPAPERARKLPSVAPRQVHAKPVQSELFA